MRRSTRLPEVEKTSLFGTAVHAVLRRRTASTPTLAARRLRRAGHDRRQSVEPVAPSLEDVFLDVVERAGGADGVTKGAGRLP